MKFSSRGVNFSDPADKARNDRMVTLVTQMLQSISNLMVRNGFREEPVRVLRCPRGSSEHQGKEDSRSLRCLNKIVQDATLDHEKTLLQRQIEATDAAIDKLVYELYGLTDEEIAIVEGNAK
jgi:hypothetical protein